MTGVTGPTGRGSESVLDRAVRVLEAFSRDRPRLTVAALAAVLLVTFSMLGVAAMALFLSTTTDSPLSATLGALAFLIGSSLLLTVDAARPLQPYLPTRYWLAFVDFFRDPVPTREIFRGVALQAVYVAVFLGAAWANLSTKDVTS